MTEETDNNIDVLIELTADVVSAYVSNNPVPVGELPDLIGQVHAALKGTAGASLSAEEPEVLKPAVSIRKSVTPDHIICLEDGKQFKSLKRHLSTHYGLTPDDYRANGVCRRIIRWSRRTTPLRARHWLRRWVLAANRKSRKRRHSRQSGPARRSQLDFSNRALFWGRAVPSA
jgi:predicted transcriptional regulator